VLLSLCNYARWDVHKVVLVKIPIFLDVMLCYSVSGTGAIANDLSASICRFKQSTQNSNKTLWSFEMTATTRPAAWHHVPEGWHLDYVLFVNHFSWHKLTFTILWDHTLVSKMHCPMAQHATCWSLNVYLVPI